MGYTYPVQKPADQDWDLTTGPGGAGRAKGDIVYFTGRVVDRNGKPILGARIEIWQANAAGRYTHPSDSDSKYPLDPNFDGYALQMTDDQGWFRFKTIKPGPYPGGKGWMRAPHIHVDISGRESRLITQVYLEGEALNKTDRFILATPRSNTLIAKSRKPEPGIEPGAQVFYWESVLSEY